MSKQIACKCCTKELGSIQKGRVSKGLTSICSACYTRLTEAAGKWIQLESNSAWVSR